MKVNPEPRQHTQGLDAGSVILQTVHHGLRARSSVLWREQMITRRPCSCPATHRHKISKLPSTQRGRLNNKLSWCPVVSRRRKEDCHDGTGTRARPDPALGRRLQPGSGGRTDGLYSCGHRCPAGATRPGRDSIDPAALAGNIENFVGAAQVPIGIAGPLLVDGEHAQGEFYVPMATTEGTLVASYNRGMKLLHRAGGVKTTVMDDRMRDAAASS